MKTWQLKNSIVSKYNDISQITAGYFNGSVRLLAARLSIIQLRCEDFVLELKSHVVFFQATNFLPYIDELGWEKRLMK